MAGRHRKQSGARWSAGTSAYWYDTTGARLPDAAADRAVRVQVRWRYDGKPGKRTFTGPTCASEAQRLLSLLDAAAKHGWPADEERLPIPQPVAAVVPSAHDADGGVEHPLVIPAPAPLPTPTADDRPAHLRDVAALGDWYLEWLRTHRKKKGGERLSPKTFLDYRSHVTFIVANLRYAPGDPRLAAAGRQAGDSMVLDPISGVRPADLLRLVDVRRATNGTIREANERRLEAWRRAVAREEQEAAQEMRTAVLPPAPRLRCEEASSRTMEECARNARAMFELAFGYERITYQPWTRAVTDHVPHPYAPAYTTKNVASPDEVWELAEAFSTFERTSTDATGRFISVTGDRYVGLVALAGREGPRPEESIALRHSHVAFGPGVVKIDLCGGEVNHPKWLTGAPRARTQVSLKHRRPGTVRTIEVTDPRVVAALARHFERYVAKPDPTSTDPDRRDPRVFTTHRGAPIDLGNFGDKWWKPAVGLLFGTTEKPHLQHLEFKDLRAAAITSWLVAGWSLRRCAKKAGNSQGVIEKHYAGVLGEIGYEGTDREGVPAATLSDLATFSENDLRKLSQAIRKERHRRVDIDEEFEPVT